MLDYDLLYSLAVGIAVMGLIFVGLGGPHMAAAGKKAIGVASAAVGYIVTIYLWQHHGELERLTREIAFRGIAVLLIALAGGAAYWRSRH